MRPEEEIDELLIEWELSRQRGVELAAIDLCRESSHLLHELEQQIAVLQKTSWMLLDPAPPPYSELVLNSVSKITFAELAAQDTKLSHSDTLEKQAAGLHLSRLAANHAQDSIPGFQLLSELGRGGFGVVYRALDEKLNREVAIKFPLVNDSRYRDKYVSEARHAASVEVPGIVPVLQVGTTADGVPFVVQKLIDGRSLAEILKREGPLDAARVARFLSQVCTAVGAAHAKSLVHRDLKPGNILFDSQDRPWVTDFGLAVTEEEQERFQGEVAGTPSYMSPEQLLGRVEWLDGRTDIWALGIILYQSLTGKLPFAAINRAELRNQILNREPRPICQRQPHLDQQWDVIFQRCCAKSMKHRYDTAFDLARDLLSLAAPQEASGIAFRDAQDVGISLSATKIRPAHAESTPNLSSRQPFNALNRWLLAATLLGVVILISVAITGTFWRPSRSTPSAGELLAETEVSKLRPQDAGSAALVVSIDGPAEAFTTIQAAIDAAREDQEIVVVPGRYEECVFITKRVKLRADGPANAVAIVGKTGPAITVARKGSLTMTGLSISTHDSDDKLFNSIDVQGGALTLDHCDVAATGLYCIRLAPDSSITAEYCNFYAARHPAIYAKRAQQLNIRACYFRLEPHSLDPQHELILVGIQATQSGGSISECTFVGRQATAIEWRDTLQTAVISDCHFTNLARGVAAFTCEDVRIAGQVKSTFSGCRTAIELNACGGWIKNCDIDGQRTANAAGIQIHDNALTLKKEDSFAIESCTLTATDVALTMSQTRVNATLLTVSDSLSTGMRCLDNSTLAISESEIRGSTDFGILLQSSHAEMERCVVSDNAVAGVVVDGLENSLVSKGCMLTGNPVGIILLSGSASLLETEVEGSDTGVLIARKHLLYQQPTCDAPLGLTCLRGRIEANLRAVHFLSPGYYRIDACELTDGAGNRPVLGEGLVEAASERFTFVNAVN